LTGKVDNDEFIATDMLMKCPSKYKDEEIQMKKAAQGSL
jgi:cytochrome c-type biogenesis protein CcmE